MTIQRMEHVGIVVDDLAAATAFFVELGLKLQGEGPVEGGWVDRVVGLEGVRAEIAMVETPDGHGRLELTKFHAPSGRGGDRHAPANTPGIRHVAFAVDDIDAVVASLRARGAELVGEVERYEDSYRKASGSATAPPRAPARPCRPLRLAVVVSPVRAWSAPSGAAPPARPPLPPSRVGRGRAPGLRRGWWARSGVGPRR